MAAAIRNVFPDASVELIGGARGAFTVMNGDREIWNKHKEGSFPEESQVVSALQQ